MVLQPDKCQIHKPDWTCSWAASSDQLPAFSLLCWLKLWRRAWCHLTVSFIFTTAPPTSSWAFSFMMFAVLGSPVAMAAPYFPQNPASWCGAWACVSLFHLLNLEKAGVSCWFLPISSHSCSFGEHEHLHFINFIYKYRHNMMLLHYIFWQHWNVFFCFLCTFAILQHRTYPVSDPFRSSWVSLQCDTNTWI